MTIFLIVMFFKSGEVFVTDTSFKDRAQCRAFALYNTLSAPDGVKEFKCIEFRGVLWTE